MPVPRLKIFLKTLILNVLKNITNILPAFEGSNKRLIVTLNVTVLLNETCACLSFLLSESSKCLILDLSFIKERLNKGRCWDRNAKRRSITKP